MTEVESNAPRTRRATSAWWGVLAAFAGLALAALWSVAELSRASEQARRSGIALAELAQVRRALLEASVIRTAETSRVPARLRRRAEEGLTTLQTLHQANPDELRAYRRLEGLVRERLPARRRERGAAPVGLDAEIERLLRGRELVARHRLRDATRRLHARQPQALILIGVQGVLAVGALALAATRPRPRP